MRLLWIAMIVVLCIGPASCLASEAADSLLNADRALAAQSRAIGFVAAYSKAMAPDARKFDTGAPTAIGREAILLLMAKYPADLRIN